MGSTACRQYALPVAIIVILLLLSTSDFDALAGTNELDLQEMAAQPVHVTNQTDSDGDGVHDGDDACPGTTAGTPVNATGCPEEAIFVWPDGVGGYHQGSKHYNMTSNSSLATLYEVDHMVDNATYLIEWYVTNASATTTTTTTNNNTTVTTTQVSTVASGSITTNNSNNSGSSALLHAAISLPDGCYEVWVELHNKDTNQFRDDDEFILCIGTSTNASTPAASDSDGDGVHDGDDACPGTTAGTPVNAKGCPEEAIFIWPDGVGGYHQGSKRYNMTSNSSLATMYEVDHMVDNATYLIEWYVRNSTTTPGTVVASGNITTNNSNNSGSSALLHAAISLPDGCYEVWVELHNKDTNQFRDDDEFILCIGTITTITTTTNTTNTTNATTPETPDSDGDGVPDAEDKCPETDAGAIVDIDGCAANQYDTDGDGVHDGDDACPRTPVGTEVNSFGCPEEEDSSPAAEEEEAEAALVPGFSILSTVAGVVLAAMVITSRRIGQECLDR